jgi:hypothetical protein
MIWRGPRSRTETQVRHGVIDRLVVWAGVLAKRHFARQPRSCAKGIHERAVARVRRHSYVKARSRSAHLPLRAGAAFGRGVH